MSDRGRDQDRPAPTSSTAGASEPTIQSPRPPPPAPQYQPPGPPRRSLTSPNPQHGSRNPMQLPPLPQGSVATVDTPSPSTGRLAGFASILNPSDPEASSGTRRRKIPQVESPRSAVQPLPPIFSQTNTPLSRPSPTLHHTESTEGLSRRILTPRSPSLHRAASLGQLNQPFLGSGSQRTPLSGSPRSRAYAIEPGTAGAPPLPTPISAAQHGPYGALGNVAPSLPQGSVGSRTRNLSSSASPSTSISSFSQTSQTSPAMQLAPSSGVDFATFAGAGGHFYSGPDHGSSGSGGSGSEQQRPMGIPISSSGGQNVYQMMTLETTSGTVQLPVDVQAASRVADEKRRRNAGASARFRQRRKEKEKEASTTISRLEQQMKEMSDDADFYRRERDYLAGILAHVPGAERHFPRPLSPRQRRPSTMSLPGPSGTGSASFLTSQEQQLLQSPDMGRNVRRRTSTMSLSQASSQQYPPPPGTPMQHPHAPQVGFVGTPLPPPPVPPMDPQRRASGDRPPPPPSLPPPSDLAARQQQQQQQHPSQQMQPQRQQLPALPQVLQQHSPPPPPPPPSNQWSAYQSGGQQSQRPLGDQQQQQQHGYARDQGQGGNRGY